MKLNARQVETAKPKEKPYKMADGGGLYLLVKTNGSRYWRLKYRIDGKEKLLALGVYPDVSLADARAKRDEARKGIAGGIDPLEVKKEQKVEREAQVKNTFQQIALEWHNMKVKKWSVGYASDILEAFNKDIFPFLGQRPVADIKPLELLNVLKKSKPEVQQRKQRKRANDVVKCFAMPS